MSGGPGDAIYPLDHEPLVATAMGAAEAVAQLLALDGAVQEHAQDELEDIATKLATALTDAIQWMPRRDQDTNQLLGALLKWMP